MNTCLSIFEATIGSFGTGGHCRGKRDDSMQTDELVLSFGCDVLLWQEDYHPQLNHL